MLKIAFAAAVGTTLLFASGAQALETQNGLAFNGLAFNGLAFNGLAFNGLAFNGIATDGVAEELRSAPALQATTVILKDGERVSLK
ncbi:hypothetical protein MHY87_05085 [Microvirga sp. ACRRW]|uniref:hypothetical protein n=1 Tax=Microvirga sp. ACRRW TaxID=2918205 RepID=UPI001EF42D25|nr:hypothetical protein [Microvirga sp. ACRRW]MCG7392274.1 hypothetical protein [Microvirga sp. ACRRW]